MLTRLSFAAMLAVCLTTGLASAQDSRPRFFISFKDAPVHTVCDIIAKLSGVRIVVPASATGKVTIRSKGVAWRTVLGRVAADVGHCVIQVHGGLLRLEKVNLRTRSFKLCHAKPVPSLLDALRAQLTPLVGSVEYSAGRGLLILKDQKAKVDALIGWLHSVELTAKLMEQARQLRKSLCTLTNNAEIHGEGKAAKYTAALVAELAELQKQLTEARSQLIESPTATPGK